jgi:hypothetical protein
MSIDTKRQCFLKRYYLLIRKPQSFCKNNTSPCNQCLSLYVYGAMVGNCILNYGS